MTKIAAIALMLALPGCAQTRETAEWLASDKARTAVANFKAAAAAIDCGFTAPGAALSHEIARALEAGQAKIDRAGRVRAASAALCDALGGPGDR